jgi:LacI family transcriptional regulator
LDILERCHVEPDQLAPIKAVVANKLLERESTAAAHPNPANF